MPQALKLLCLAQVVRIPFSHFLPSSLWGNKNWAPQYKDVEVGKFREQKRLQMIQFECPIIRNPLVSSTFQEICNKMSDRLEVAVLMVFWYCL